MINEQLLLQKGKDLGLADEVEAEVNKRMLQVALRSAPRADLLRTALQQPGRIN